MNRNTIEHVKLVGIASAVPETVVTLQDDISALPGVDVRKISTTTGVQKRHVARNSLCASDLCYAAAEKLLEEACVERSSIDTVIFVTQTPDYILPATACILQSRLQLGKNCKAFDVNLGCSGYVYGLWLASCLISSGGSERVLLLAGDTVSRIANPKDRTALLFGDAGTATILEYDERQPASIFSLGTDGKGYKNLIVPAGAFRMPYSEETTTPIEREEGNIRRDSELYMNGTEVFSFTLREVPKMVKAVVDDMNSIDAVVMHQANKFIIEFIAKKLKIDSSMIKLSLGEYGNTSSASIPITISKTLTVLRESPMNLLLAGFGVGFSWGAAVISCGPITLPDILTVSEETKEVL